MASRAPVLAEEWHVLREPLGRDILPCRRFRWENYAARIVVLAQGHCSRLAPVHVLIQFRNPTHNQTRFHTWKRHSTHCHTLIHFLSGCRPLKRGLCLYRLSCSLVGTYCQHYQSLSQNLSV